MAGPLEKGLSGSQPHGWGKRRKREANQYAWPFKPQENIPNQVSIPLSRQKGRFPAVGRETRSFLSPGARIHPSKNTPPLAFPILGTPTRLHQLPKPELGVTKLPCASTLTFVLILLPRKTLNPSVLPWPCSSSGHSHLRFPTTASWPFPCLPSYPHQMPPAHCSAR